MIEQVGGDHYSKAKYQHWHWASDLNLSYPLAAATKYLYRWSSKGTPIQDLQKAVSYIQFQYTGWKGESVKNLTGEGFIKMVQKLTWPCPKTQEAVKCLLLRKFRLAEAIIQEIIDAQTQVG